MSHSHLLTILQSQTGDSVGCAVSDTVCDSLVSSFFSEGMSGQIIPVPRVQYDVLEGWNLAIIGLILLVIVLNKQLYPMQFRQLLSVPGGVAHTNQLLREWSPLRSFMGVAFAVLYVLGVSLFVQKSCVVLSRDVAKFNSFHAFNIILSCVSAWVLLRYLVMYFLNWLFRAKDAVERQVSVELSVSAFFVIAMLPVLLLLLYNPYSAFVKIGLCIMMIAAVLRVVLKIIETRAVLKNASLYIFLYFCSLEIVPIALLLVAGSRYFNQGSVF